MAVNLWFTLAGYRLIPAVEGLERVESPLRDTLPMRPGNNRHYQRPAARRTRWTLVYPFAPTADWTTWRLAARAAEAGASLIEPDGTTHSVILVEFVDPISNSNPTTGAGTVNATGTVERDLTLVLETI